MSGHYTGGVRTSNFTEKIDLFGMSGADSSRTGNIAELEHRIAQLHLQVQTLARLLVAKGAVSERELDEWMEFVDEMDGRRDGKLAQARSPKNCPGCGRMNPVKAVRCLYCDIDLPRTKFLQEADTG